MSQALEQTVIAAIDAQGDQQLANKAYLEFMKANFIIPIEKTDHQGEPVVLFLRDGTNTFLPAFTEKTYLDEWASSITDHIQLLKLSGFDLLKGTGDQVTVCLNLGTPSYKAFNPSEIARMRSMVIKLFK